MIEGTGSGSIPLTNGSGSGSRRPKTYGSNRSGSTTLPFRQIIVQLRCRCSKHIIYQTASRLLSTAPRRDSKIVGCTFIKKTAVLWIRDVLSRISDPGSNNSNKREGGEKNLLSYLFLLPQISQNCKLFYFWHAEEKNLGHFSKNYRTFCPKNCH